ncbi:hypothetical protein AZE42_13273, partial [Rhizopogon vesiculosus]
MPTLSFHIGLVRARWYQDPNLNIQSVAAVSLENVPRNSALQSTSLTVSSSHISNPLDSSSAQLRNAVPPHRLLTLINGVQTKEELDELLQDLDELRRTKAEEARSALIRDPPIIQQKGRSRSARLTGAIEGHLVNAGFVDGRDTHGKTVTGLEKWMIKLITLIAQNFSSKVFLEASTPKKCRSRWDATPAEGAVGETPKRSHWDQAAVIPEAPMTQIIMNAPGVMQEDKHNRY